MSVYKMAEETAKPVGIGKNTYETWKVAIDPNGEWLRAEVVGAMVVRVWCVLCTKHHERVRGFRNFSDAFITGIRGSALKKDNVFRKPRTRLWCLANILTM